MAVSVRPFPFVLRFLVLAMSVLAAAGLARADDYIDRVNAMYKDIAPDKRTDKVLFPLMAKMAPPPADVDTPLKAALMPASASKFKAAADWAQGDPQKAVIEAVKKVTEMKDYKSAYAIGQGYGANAVDPDTIATNMWTDLGTPELLTSANFMFIPKLRDVFTLLHVEATRLAAEGKVWEAMELTVANLYLARQVADRAFFAEQLPGLQACVLSLNRIRDIAYMDVISGSPKLTAENMRSLIEKHNDVKLLGIKRLTLARADAVGLEQLIGYVFEKGGKPNRDFAPFLARLSSRDRPLRAFSETAKWEAIAPLHANEIETRQKVADVFGDWNNRWKLDPFDGKLKLPTDYAKLDKTRFALVEQFFGDMSEAFTYQSQLRVEAVGTTTSLGVIGFRLANRQFPPDVTSIRPTFMARVDLDPFDRTHTNNLRYLVPGTKGTPNPYEIRLLPDFNGVRYPNFAIPLRDDTFILFSVGPDGNASGAKLATQMAFDERGDYLIFPPMLSMVRKHLIERDNSPYK
ncbi:MAG: hypothetical protein ACREJO_14230 [Phycisphaerales bacterium]